MYKYNINNVLYYLVALIEFIAVRLVYII